MARSNRTKSRRGQRDRQTERETAARFHSATPHSLFHFRAEPLLSVLTRPTNPPTNFAFLLARGGTGAQAEREGREGRPRRVGMNPLNFQSGPISSFFSRDRRSVSVCAKDTLASQSTALTLTRADLDSGRVFSRPTRPPAVECCRMPILHLPLIPPPPPPPSFFRVFLFGWGAMPYPPIGHFSCRRRRTRRPPALQPLLPTFFRPLFPE